VCADFNHAVKISSQGVLDEIGFTAAAKVSFVVLGVCVCVCVCVCLSVPVTEVCVFKCACYRGVCV